MANNDTRNGVNQGRASSPARGRGPRGGQAPSPTDGVHVEGDSSPPTSPPGGRGAAKHVPERKCILSGEKDARDRLIRLALAPDGTVAPDVRARAPGRGAWIGVDQATLEAAIAKGKLKGALMRAFKTSQITIPADLPQQIEAALQRAALDRLGLEAKAGTLLTGAEKIAQSARQGAVALLLHASDAAADGNRKLDQALRVGRETEGSDERGLVIPASRAILSMALGRENVVHIALIAPAAAARVSDALGRWRSFIGREEEAVPCESVSQGATALDIE